LVWLNRVGFVPATASARLSGTDPVLVTMTASGALVVPTKIAGNAIEGTEGETLVPASKLRVPTEVAAAPARATDAVLPVALLGTFNTAEKFPAVPEVKVTAIEQDAPVATADPQVFPVTVKSLGLAPPVVGTPTITVSPPVLVSVAVRVSPKETAVEKLRAAGPNDA
jgi:hypothetical protein